MKTILETKNLKKYYGDGDLQVKALDGVDLRIEEGEFVAVVGTSGSGKSTLLHMLGGLDYATSGTVTVAGRKIFELNEKELTIFRRRQIGFIFQNYNLVPILSIYENIVLPLELDGRRVDKGFMKKIVRTLGLENRLSDLPGQLSGGQLFQQDAEPSSCPALQGLPHDAHAEQEQAQAAQQGECAKNVHEIDASF